MKLHEQLVCLGYALATVVLPSVEYRTLKRCRAGLYSSTGCFEGGGTVDLSARGQWAEVTSRAPLSELLVTLSVGALSAFDADQDIHVPMPRCSTKRRRGICESGFRLPRSIDIVSGETIDERYT